MTFLQKNNMESWDRSEDRRDIKNLENFKEDFFSSME
jgi:hypothetical protein